MSHSITWLHALSVKRVDINGATAFAVSGKLKPSFLLSHIYIHTYMRMYIYICSPALMRPTGFLLQNAIPDAFETKIC